MRRVGLILLLILFCQCHQERAKFPYRAKILVSTDTGYRMQVVQFSTLRDLDSVSGDVAELWGNPEIEIFEANEIMGEDDYKLHSSGETVKLDYTLDKEGVAIPADFGSMSMLTLYYHYEGIWFFWKNIMGLGDDFEKRRLLIDPRIIEKSEDGVASAKMKLNAAYVPHNKDFWLFSTSRLEKLPIKMNKAILAHEFGHAIFDYYFANNENGSARSNRQLSGMNEGLADFFAWMVTGRVDEFTESMGFEERVLPVKWDARTLKEKGEKVCKGGFYCKGSVLASALYEVAEALGEGGNIVVGKDVCRALGFFSKDWSEQRLYADFDYYYLLIRIVKVAKQELRPTYCKYFKKWFNDDLNRGKLKRVCRNI